MNALAGPTDAELVGRVLQADREAFALVYDRYGPRLYDFAYSMLRHPEDAADAVADAFVTFAEKLPQLREPDRLRPWLYAIVRSECLRRLKARKRVSYGDDEQLMAMPDDAVTPEQAAERAMLTQLVWDAAAGLADRDRALLDLHLRQGLDGADLGEAMGVTAANAYVMLNRLRAQVDRSLGALLIARLGREDCDELDALLVDWDGTFSPLIRKRVARHVEGCTTCGERRSKMLSPWMLLAGVPVFVAPLTLRERVLDETRLVAYAGAPSTSPGGPGSPGSPGSPRLPAGRRSRARGAAVAAVLIAAAGVSAVVITQNDSDDTPSVAVAPPTPSLGGTDPAPVPTSAPSAPASVTPSPRATDQPSSTTSPSLTAAPLPGTLVLSTRSIDLGLTRTSGSVRVSGRGEGPVGFTATSDTDWLSASPASATVDASSSTVLRLRADRGRIPEGAASGRVRLSWDGGSATVTVRLRQENEPTVGRPSVVGEASCSFPVRAVVSDESRLTSVVLSWSGTYTGRAAMQSSGDGWTTPPLTFDNDVSGTVTFRVTATDARGNTTVGPSRSLTVTACPNPG